MKTRNFVPSLDKLESRISLSAIVAVVSPDDVPPPDPEPDPGPFPGPPRITQLGSALQAVRGRLAEYS